MGRGGSLGSLRTMRSTKSDLQCRPMVCSALGSGCLTRLSLLSLLISRLMVSQSRGLRMASNSLHTRRRWRTSFFEPESVAASSTRISISGGRSFIMGVDAAAVPRVQSGDDENPEDPRRLSDENPNEGRAW